MRLIHVALGSLCKEITRYPTYYGIKYVPEGIPEVRGQLINKNGELDYIPSEIRYIDKKTDSRFPKTKLEKNDLVMSVRGTVGKVGIVSDNFIGANITANLIRISPNSSVVYPKYLWRYILSDYFQHVLNNATSSTTIKTIKAPILKKIKIPLPPFDIQKKIAIVLDKADQLRQKRKKTIEKLDQLIQSVFLDMFGDPVKNPEGWKLLKFGNVGSLERGKSKHRPRNAPELLGGLHPLIQTGNVANSGGYIRKYNQTYSELGLKQSRMWPKGTLCITIAANIAKTGILTFDACFPDSVVGFTPSENVTIEYVQSWMSFLQEVLEKTAPESAQKNINLKILSELDIPVPPIKLQNKFSKIVKKIETEKLIYNTIESKLDNLFSSLLQRAFKGELKFNDKVFKELEHTMT